MKFYGTVGYAESKETAPGVYIEDITERSYYGDVVQYSRRLENGQGSNDNIVLNGTISIVSDPYANEHFFAIRYISWMGSKWKVTNVTPQPPRLELTLGGVYNGQ